MGSSSILLLVTVFLPIFVSGGIVDFCGFDYGAIHSGSISYNDAHVLEQRTGLRSKVECATECYADYRCRTAVYEHDGDCFLVANFTENLSLRGHNSNSGYGDYVLEMKTKTQMSTSSGASEVVIGCPSDCTGYSVCVLDCTGNALEPEPMCMDLTTSQYTDNSCGFRPYRQTKEYYLSNLDKNYASTSWYFQIYFEKMYDWTTLRVQWRGTLRGGYGHNWGRWKILFDGSDCGNPGWIESLNYNSESNTDHQKATGIHGICQGISAGNRQIGLYAEIHSSQFRAGYATQASRLYVDELGQGTFGSEPSVASCPSLPVFNIREHITTSEWGNDHSATLWSMGYTKMEASTAIRVNVDLMIRLYQGGVNSNKCVTYYIYIDGSNCSPVPIGKTLANLNYAHEVNNEHRSAEWEGHCTGVSAGYHTMTLYVHTCPWGQASGDVHTGWHSNRNRIIFEEIRLGTNIASVMDNDGETLWRVPQFNMAIHGLSNPCKGEDNSVIWTIPTYTKLYSSSGVRVSLSADGRCYWGHGSHSSYSPCCRHYFRFNNNECSNPGTIEGIHYLNKNTNLHRPVMIDGVCEGLSAGTIDVTLWAGICRHHSHPGECYFGWNSYVHLLVSETFVDREIVSF